MRVSNLYVTLAIVLYLRYNPDVSTLKTKLVSPVSRRDALNAELASRRIV
jgi:hypothetical protein